MLRSEYKRVWPSKDNIGSYFPWDLNLGLNPFMDNFHH